MYLNLERAETNFSTVVKELEYQHSVETDEYNTTLSEQKSFPNEKITNLDELILQVLKEEKSLK